MKDDRLATNEDLSAAIKDMERHLTRVMYVTALFMATVMVTVGLLF